MDLTITSNEGYKIKDNTPDIPPSRYMIPFKIVPLNDPDGNLVFGAVLAPFGYLSQSTANFVFSFSFGYLVGLFIDGLKSLKTEAVTASYAFLRPVLGGAGASITYIIVASGGALIWNQAAGVSGLSLGVISLVGSLYVDKVRKTLLHTF